VDFYQVDVFTEQAFEGNPLAVFPDAGDLTKSQMQAIAREMNLSETTFVTSTGADSYAMRIFTPAEELPFAGHPTIGTAWLLRHLGVVGGPEVIQTTAIGICPVREKKDALWFERPGEAEADLEERDPPVVDRIARFVGLERSDIGFEARELGRSGRLRPAYADAGLRQLLVPVKNLDALGRCTVWDPSDFDGAYCFTAIGAGRVRARGLWPGFGITEDPATGSAAAALGIYLGTRVGDIQFEVFQGYEMGRPSRIFVNGTSRTVEVGGKCVLVLRGSLEATF
jgi:trans-2,3-dihydro-3-hydroxyanthranilate isomerase